MIFVWLFLLFAYPLFLNFATSSSVIVSLHLPWCLAETHCDWKIQLGLACVPQVERAIKCERFFSKAEMIIQLNTKCLLVALHRGLLWLLSVPVLTLVQWIFPCMGVKFCKTAAIYKKSYSCLLIVQGWPLWSMFLGQWLPFWLRNPQSKAVFVVDHSSQVVTSSTKKGFLPPVW